MSKVYIVLTPLSSSESERVRFSEDLIGESGLDLDCLSCISACDNIFIGIAHVCKTGFEIRCGFLRQMRAVRVTAAFFDLVFVWISSYKTPGRRQLY